MTFQDAIAILAQGRGTAPEPEWDAQIDAARDVVTDETWAMIETDCTRGELHDWISMGTFDGDETPASLADEWDSLEGNNE